ncbi:thioredoxin reductase (NADPH) [Breznakia blatticola]|uniref:Thioredoxin reductase n=1 Tax=Breznakia blatticola TaxID=1754012 RepID=A0A4R7ZRH2_9FIRM|nr:thioredoxin-disulfide reductase [Breznakia blatticola]TDW20567.1 thioredoxin reductase (NADPH) [Breznakia blatticola]
MERISDVVIIGAGPAGMTAAIYASRAGLKTIMLEAGAPGGKLTKTNEISNYPGYSSANGFELATDMFQHSTTFGAQYLYGNVVDIEIDKTNSGFHSVITDDDTVYKARSVIIATGTKEQLLQVPGEMENIGRGVSYCAVCDGAFFKGKKVAVIGGGNSALEEALYLSTIVEKVYVVIRRDVFRADSIIVERVENTPNIEVIRERKVEEIVSDGKSVTGIKLYDSHDESKKELLEVSAVFPYIGATPISSWIADEGVTDVEGYIEVNEHMETKIPGLLAAGDVTKKSLRQVVTATNDGAIAAQSCVRYIKCV